MGDDMEGPTWTLKTIIAGTLRSAYSVDVGDIFMTQLKFEGLETVKIQFRSLVRATL